jgi:hypothetical protein
MAMICGLGVVESSSRLCAGCANAPQLRADILSVSNRKDREVQKRGAMSLKLFMVCYMVWYRREEERKELAEQSAWKIYGSSTEL